MISDKKFDHKTDFIKKELRSLISRFSRERRRHKLTALWLSLLTAIFAASATILIGWEKPAHPELLKNLALIFNASITVIAAYQVFFRPKKLWIQETCVFSELKDIEREFNYELAGREEMEEDKLSTFRSRITEVLDKSMNDWKKDKNS
ncbi:MAG: DUF4231 domain-containing protein [Bacteroidota bacterium]